MMLTKQPLSLTEGPVITLEQMLVARELRVERQQQWLAEYKLPLVSLTMVIPGEIKKSSASCFLFKEAVAFFNSVLQDKKLMSIKQQQFTSDCGMEALFAINSQAELIKQVCIELESSHLLGRFWDFDVICPQQGGLSRRKQNMAVRKCLACENDAHACARSRSHSIDQLIQVIEEQINVFRSAS